MTRNTRVWAICVAVIGLCAGTASAAEIILQKGLIVNGAVYDGVRDGWMEAGDVYANHNDGTTIPENRFMQVTGYATYNPGLTENRCRGLLKFDLTTLPSGLNIVSAKVQLYATNSNSADKGGAMGAYNLFRIKQSWNPGQVCWAYRQNEPVIASWDGATDHYDTPADASAPKQALANPPPTAGIWYEWDVTTRVQEWYANGGVTNFGWIVKAQDENMNIQSQFRTSDVAGDLKPKLIIVTGSKLGDVNGDGFVNVGDLQCLIRAYGTVEGDSNYDLRCDFNGDLAVNVSDLQTMVAQWCK